MKSLQINQDLRFQKKMWRAEAIARCGVATILLAALFGLTGGGGCLSKRQASTSSDSVEIQYEGYVRREAESLLIVRLAPRNREFWIDSDYLEKMSFVEIQPPPPETRPLADRTVFNYPKSDGYLTLRLRFRTWALGQIQGRIGREEEAVELRQWIFP